MILLNFFIQSEPALNIRFVILKFLFFILIKKCLTNLVPFIVHKFSLALVSFI